MPAYTGISIIGAILSILLIGILAYFYHTRGVLLGFVLSQFLLFLAGLAFFRKLPISVGIIRSIVDKIMLRKLLIFALMAVTSAIVHYH